MAELNKGQLTAENTASFPNNTVGYITPTLLRTFNQNMIDSLVDEVTYNADSASVSASISQLKNFSSSLDNTYATDAQLSASASTLQNNINSLSASVAVTDLAQSSSIAQLLGFSSSLDATFATDAQLSASASTLQNQINLKVNISQTSSMSVLSSSYAVTSSYALQALTASYAGNVPLTASYSISSSQAITASFLLGSIASASYAGFAETASFLLGSVNTASFAFTSSVTQQVSTSISSQNIQHNVLFVDTTGPGFVQVDGGLRYNPNTNLLTTTASLALTASFSLTASFAENVGDNYATTGSNTFIGNQIISGNLDVTGKITALSASITYLETIYETASVIYSSGSNQLGDELSDVQTLSGSVKVQGTLSVNGTNVIIDSQTGSFATTGSNNFIGNQTITGSLTLSSSADVELNIIGNTNISGTLLVSGGFNAKVNYPALNTTTNIIQSTGSGVVVSQDIVRQGGGSTDVIQHKIQTISGSLTSGDTLASFIQAGNTLNTSTFMSGGSAVTVLNSIWATGSGGTRVSYTAGATLTAASASATFAISAGTGATLTAGTASISAGLIRIGSNVAHTISTTGSFGPMILVSPLNTPALAIRSGSFELTTPQGSGSFYSNCPITSSGLRINGTAIVKDLIISGTWGGSGSGSLQVENNASISGGLFVSGVADISSISASKGLSLTGSLPTIVSGNLSGSLIGNLGSVYTSSIIPQNIVGIGSASMAYLLSTGGTTANTLYFVI
jgi:hypothetical protein